MKEPRRLLDEASGLDREILESAFDDAPTATRRRRVLAGIAVTSATAFSSSAAAATVGRIAVWKVVVGVAAVGGVGIGGAVLQSQHSSPSPAAIFASASVNVPPAPRPRPVLSTPRQPSPEAPRAQVDATPTVVVTAPKPRTLTAPPVKMQEPAPMVASIAREIALIDRARSAIARRDAASALAALDEYDVGFRGGTLSLEAAVLRIEALAASGDREAAAANARGFLERHPHSAYEARARAHLSNR